MYIYILSDSICIKIQVCINIRAVSHFQFSKNVRKKCQENMVLHKVIFFLEELEFLGKTAFISLSVFELHKYEALAVRSPVCLSICEKISIIKNYHQKLLEI